MSRPVLVAAACAVAAAVAPAATSSAAQPAGASQSTAKPSLLKAHGCGDDWYSGVAGYGNWLTATGDCSVFGSPGARVAYKWAVPGESNGQICVQAWRPGNEWVSMGCGKSGSVTVPWGNNTAMKRVRGMVAPGFFGAAFRWQ